MRINETFRNQIKEIITSQNFSLDQFNISGGDSDMNIDYKYNNFIFHIHKVNESTYRITHNTVSNLNHVAVGKHWFDLTSLFKSWVAQIYKDVESSGKLQVKTEKEFPLFIKKSSKKFIEIYNQAENAEKSGLNEICGLGYRKAFEFLIKDYILKKNKGLDKKKIKEMPVYECINRYVADDSIKILSHRVLWLGNDHAHYLKKWKGKTLLDLKNLIDLTIRWIDVHEEFLKIEKKMPTKTK